MNVNKQYADTFSNGVTVYNAFVDENLSKEEIQAAHKEILALGSSAAAASGEGSVNPLYDPSATATATATATRRSFSREFTEDGAEYFVPVAGGGDPVWELPAFGAGGLCSMSGAISRAPIGTPGE